eukprot:1139665-Pelagomonas_calceolata.AAC.1
MGAQQMGRGEHTSDDKQAQTEEHTVTARFRLRAHTLRVEASLRQEHTPECDRWDQRGLQDEKHAMFLCSCNPACSLKRTCANLFSDFYSPYHPLLTGLF